MKRTLHCIIVLLLAAGVLCACSPIPPLNPSHISPTPRGEALQPHPKQYEHYCNLENYYTINVTHEPEYSMHVVIHDIQGSEIYNETYTFEVAISHVGDCILSVSYYTGTMNTVVTYIDIHTGKTATYDNPVLAGHGVVCVVVPNLDDTKLVYKIYSMFEPGEPILVEEFDAAIWTIPHSAITNSSFWRDNTILLTYMLPDEEHEKTIMISLP